MKIQKKRNDKPRSDLDDVEMLHFIKTGKFKDKKRGKEWLEKV